MSGILDTTLGTGGSWTLDQIREGQWPQWQSPSTLEQTTDRPFQDGGPTADPRLPTWLATDVLHSAKGGVPQLSGKIKVLRSARSIKHPKRCLTLDARHIEGHPGVALERVELCPRVLALDAGGGTCSVHILLSYICYMVIRARFYPHWTLWTHRARSDFNTT